MTSVLRLFVASLLLIPALAWLSGGAAFLATSATGRGQFAAVSALLLGVAMTMIAAACSFSGVWARMRIAVVGCATASLAIWVSLSMSAPGGTGGDDRLRMEHVFLSPSSHFSRWAISNVIPEIDQVTFGLFLVRLLDRHIDEKAVHRILESTAPLYREFGADAAFRDMGSVWAQAFDWQGHYVAIAPKGPSHRGIVFLHGSVGNFASYWYALSPLARRDDIALMFPSFGFGNWEQPGGVYSVDRVIDDAHTRFAVDPENLILAGISNGGRGITRAVAHGQHRYRGIIFISAVIEPDVISEGIAAGHWKDLPVLLIHGDRDDRVSIENALRQATRLEQAGANVTRMILRGEDHFALNAKRDAVLQEIRRWMGEV